MSRMEGYSSGFPLRVILLPQETSGNLCRHFRLSQLGGSSGGGGRSTGSTGI